jgi:DNA repair protein RadA/Sms
MPSRPGWKLIAGGKSPVFTCYLCDFETRERSTTCPGCGRFDTLVRDEPEVAEPKAPKNAAKLELRKPEFVSTGSPAWDLVLGGGFVKPSSILLYGPSGVGKSTRALALAVHAAELVRGKVLYGSAEMPAENVRVYAERIGLSAARLERLWVQDSRDAHDLLENIDQIRPAVVVWDSIQRMLWGGELGDIALREVVHAAIESCQRTGHVAILLSQVSKDRGFSGPSGIEHDVDVSVRLRREDGDLVIEAPHKNRFAPTPAHGRERFGAEEPDRAPSEHVPVPLDHKQPLPDR